MNLETNSLLYISYIVVLIIQVLLLTKHEFSERFIRWIFVL